METPLSSQSPSLQSNDNATSQPSQAGAVAPTGEITVTPSQPVESPSTTPEAQTPSIENKPDAESTTAPIETVVVPSLGQEVQNPSFLQGMTSETNQTTQASPSRGNSWGRRILLVVVFLVLIIGIFVGGQFIWGIVAGGKEVSLTYWGLWENEAYVRTMIADFENAHPKIKVQYTKQSPKQYRERLQAAISRGEGPDVFRFHNTWVPMLARDLAPVPKTIMTATEFSSTFYPVATGDLVAGSSVYGIPLMIDGLGLYYNEDLFATAGVSAPTTWNDVLDIVPKLTVKNETGIVTSAIALGTAGNVEHFSDILATMIMQNGAKLTNLESKEAEETLIFYHKFADPSDPVYTWSEALDNSISAFANGRVAMILAPSWRAFDIKQINPSLRFKIAPIPQLPGNTITWASYWVEGVSAKSKNQEQAWEFVKYLTSRETATKLYTEISKSRLFGEPYARVDLGTSLSSDPLVGAYMKQAQTAKSFPLASRTFDNGINDKLIKYLEDAVNSVSTGNSPSKALETAQSGFTQVLSSYGLSSANVAP